MCDAKCGSAAKAFGADFGELPAKHAFFAGIKGFLMGCRQGQGLIFTGNSGKEGS